MVNEKVAEIHNEIFEHLMKWHQTCPKDELNPYFYIRTRNDDRFVNGYWFPGDNNYLALSFWAGGDSLNKTQNIYLNINYEKGISIILTGRDSDFKQNYFKNLANYLGNFNYRGDGLWSRPFAPFNENYLQAIDTFIHNEKAQIDKYIQSTIDQSGSTKRTIEDADEYSTAFGFIEAKTFDKHSSRVIQLKAARNRDSQIKAISDNPTPQNNVSNITNSLPIAIESIEIADFRGIKETGRVDFSTAANWIFITGENGYGKTTFLQAVALGITNYSENKDYLKNAKINTLYIKDDQANYVSTFSRDEDVELLNNHFIGYGPIRLIPQPESAENTDGVTSTNIYNLFHSNGLLKSLKYLMTKSKLVSDSDFVKVKNALIEVLDGRISDIKFDREKADFVFTERLRNGDLIEGLSYNDLATGYKNTLNLVGDIIVRFSKSQPNVPYSEFVGIIIIDEIENHLHPKMQRELPDFLSKVFPKIQFIASTHSPIPLLCSVQEIVILNVTRNSENGITVSRLKKLEKEVKTLLPDTILTSSIFNFDYLDQIKEDVFDKLPLQDSYGDIEKYRQLNERLNNLDPSIFPDELFNNE